MKETLESDSAGLLILVSIFFEDTLYIVVLYMYISKTYLGAERTNYPVVYV